MNKKILLLLPFVFILLSMKTDKPAYKLFNQNGKEVKYKKLLKEAQDADIVFFGEYHNNPICHWLQIELTQDLYKLKQSNLVLGAEMIEANEQDLLDEYLKEEIDAETFEQEAELWKNYKTDYKPLIEFAEENQLKFVASNVPRRYASLVHSNGFDGLNDLSEGAKLLLPPLPVAYDPELPGYKAMMEMMGGMGSGHANDNLPKAQAIKDATMAHFILQNLEAGQTFVHYNGAYHSNNFEGIYWYLKQQRPELKILTITTVEQENLDNLTEENEGVADYTICVPTAMTKTY
jgi:uncharacterized iron-regulated protein